MISTPVQQIEQAVEDDRGGRREHDPAPSVEVGRDSTCATHVREASIVVH
jgi:hypothetical protein